MKPTTITMRDGSVTIPLELRRRFGIAGDALLIVEAGEAGILLRPAQWPEPETFTPERIAEFLLNTAVDEPDYGEAVEEVRKLGFDPSAIPRTPPPEIQ